MRHTESGEDFADDILAAHAARRQMIHAARTNPVTPTGRAALRCYIDSIMTNQAPMPMTMTAGKPSLARTYICARTGAALIQLEVMLRRRKDVIAAAVQHPGPCPLDIDITGKISGKPWRTTLDFGEAPFLWRHLGTAAFIVCAYLTGMRPAEILGLRSGCCPDPEPDEHGVTGRHLIRGHVYKTATDDEGNHISAGVEHDVPWVAITPVVNAIRVLEHMVPDGHLLFDSRLHDRKQVAVRTGSLKDTSIRERIEDFLTWANKQALAHDLVEETIPADPHGNIGMMRFRRSLACARSVSDRLLENRIGPTAVLVGAGCR